MRILKILLLSSCLAAFGAAGALAATTPDTASGQPTTKPKTTKVVKKRTPAKRHVTSKRTLKKHTLARATTKTKPKSTPSTETAPGNPPGSTTN